MLKSSIIFRNLKSFLLFCFLIFEATSYILKFIIKTNNAKQFITKNNIIKFTIAKSIIIKFAIAKFVIVKSIIAKYIAQKSFTIIVQLSNNFYNNIIFNIKNLFCN